MRLRSVSRVIPRHCGKMYGAAEDQGGSGKYEFTSSGMPDINAAYGTLLNRYCVDDALVNLISGLVGVDWEVGHLSLGARKSDGSGAIQHETPISVRRD